MQAIAEIENRYRKPAIAQVQSGDTVRVHQLIREGAKQRVQVFEGVVIRTDRLGSLTSSITVRRIASNVGVEKTFLLHSPNVQKVEVVRRSKVRRNFLSYLRGRRGKSARLQELGFDKAAANVKDVKPEEAKDAEVAELVADQAADDADVTEIPSETSETPVESTDEVVKEEVKEAAAEEAADPADDAGEQGDEDAARSEEVQEGLDKAAKEDE